MEGPDKGKPPLYSGGLEAPRLTVVSTPSSVGQDTHNLTDSLGPLALLSLCTS